MGPNALVAHPSPRFHGGMGQLDVVSVGDAATDVFICLRDRRIHVEDDPSGRWLKLPFGDKVPFDHSTTIEAGGNAANAAVGLARLGLATALATHVGADEIGRNMQAALQQHGVDTRFMRIDSGMPSNRNFVLWYGDDRTILVRHEAYDYHWPHLAPAEVPRWLYLSSVGNEAPRYHEQLARWLDEEPSVRFAFQPGTLQIEQGAAALEPLYRRADLLICNREEAVEITGGDHGDIDDLITRLRRLAPRTAVVTDGAAGSRGSDGRHVYSVPSYPDPAPPTDRTGAGDAFSSAFVGALAKGRTLEEAFAWGPVNAMSVVQHVGSQAGLLTEGEILEYLKGAPSGFTVTRR